MLRFAKWVALLGVLAALSTPAGAQQEQGQAHQQDDDDRLQGGQGQAEQARGPYHHSICPAVSTTTRPAAIRQRKPARMATPAVNWPQAMASCQPVGRVAVQWVSPDGAANGW